MHSVDEQILWYSVEFVILIIINIFHHKNVNSIAGISARTSYLVSVCLRISSRVGQ